MDAVAAEMADVLAAVLAPDADAARLPYLTEPIGPLTDVSGVIFSGGVAEYVYGNETRDFGDLGRRLGLAITSRLADGSIPFPLLSAAARIRATALGASEFSLQLSGPTCYVADAGTLLPRRNVQVVRPGYELGDEIDATELAAAIVAQMRTFGARENESDLVLALGWTGRVTYKRLSAFALAISSALAHRIAAGHPLMLAVDADIGHALGGILCDELHVATSVLVVDGLNLLNFDYIDLGRPLQPSQAIPVTIKSLAF
jgi:ethanolamine utilization protein EutA